MQSTNIHPPFKKHHFSIFIFVFLLTSLFSMNLAAQFRNNGVQLPNIGILGLGCLSSGATTINGAPICGGNDDFQRYYNQTSNPEKAGQKINGWGATHQLTLGTGYMRSLGYQLWLEIQAGFGVGSAVIVETATFGGGFQPILSVFQSTGLRYNFVESEFRPFVSGHIQLMWMNGQGAAIRKSAVLGNQSAWAGARIGAGVEWFFFPTLRQSGIDIDLFFDEISLQVEANQVVFADLAGYPLSSQYFRMSFNSYF